MYKKVRWYKEAKKVLAQNKSTNGDQKVSGQGNYSLGKPLLLSN